MIERAMISCGRDYSKLIFQTNLQRKNLAHNRVWRSSLERVTVLAAGANWVRPAMVTTRAPMYLKFPPNSTQVPFCKVSVRRRHPILAFSNGDA